MRTRATLARSITRVNRYHGYSVQSSLVFDLGFQIVKRPVIQPVALALTNRYSVTDAGKVFQSNRSLSVFSLSHKAFTNNVVMKFLIAFLFTRKLFKFSLCRLCLL